MSRLSELKFRADQAIQSGDIDQALSLYQQACGQSTLAESRHLHTQYAMLLWQCYEFGKAESLFQELIHDAGTELSTLSLIAKNFFGVGRFAKAADVLKHAAHRQPYSPEILVQWASCLERSNQMELASEAARRAALCAPENRDAVRLISHLARRSGDLQAARDSLLEHLRKYPDGETWVLKYELAACLDRMGEYDSAWEYLLQAKAQVADLSRMNLIQSYALRQKQAEFSKRITDADLNRWHLQPVETPTRIAMLAGFPRSGTTLLESILTAHPEVIGTDESGILAKQFIEPIVWQASDSLEALLEIRAWESDQIELGRKSYFKFTTAVIGEPIGGRLLVEKDPLLTCDLPIPLRLFPEAKIVLPLRDPRDVIISYFFTMVPFQWNSSPSTDIIESAKFYHDVMRHWLLFRDRLPWPWIETRYEDLVDNPSVEAQRLSVFLGIDFLPMMLDPNQRPSDIMKSTPTYDDVSKPIYSRSLGRWRNYRKQLEPVFPLLDNWAKQFQYI